MDDNSKWKSSSLEFWSFGTSSLGYAIRLLTSSGDGWIAGDLLRNVESLPCYPLVMSKELLKMAIYSGRPIQNGDFS